MSAYVNTSGVTDFGENGSVFIRSGSSGAKGSAVTWNTSGFGDGWERIYVPAQADENGTLTVNIVSDGLAGTVYVDDVQVEASLSESSGAPSSMNLVRFGDMSSTTSWWFAENADISIVSDAAFGHAYKVVGNYSTCCFGQTIHLNQPGSQTYLYSGWAKLTSLPESKCGGAGIFASVVYTDGTKESHYGYFNTDSTEWQFLVMPIVPKESGKTVFYISIEFFYHRNANTAYFANACFTKEDAQSYTYNSNGDLVSVSTPGNTTQTYSYSGADLISQVTRGNGTYTYEYDSKHNVTKASNDGVSMSLDYDSRGNTTGSVLTGSGSGEKITSSAAYDSTGSRLSSQTDARGNTVTYAYETDVSKMTGQPTAVTDPGGVTRTSTYDPANGRITGTEIDGAASLDYTYGSGRLTAMTRSGSVPGEETEQAQTYTMSYDGFGNMTGVSVGNKCLASYTYGANNGLLTQMTYGNGDSVSYSYDV